MAGGANQPGSSSLSTGALSGLVDPHPLIHLWRYVNGLVLAALLLPLLAGTASVTAGWYCYCHCWLVLLLPLLLLPLDGLLLAALLLLVHDSSTHPRQLLPLLA